MEDRHIFRKISINTAHLPTLMLIIGYVLFWFELLVLDTRDGVTTLTATIVFSLLAVLVLINDRAGIISIYKQQVDAFCQCSLFKKGFIVAGAAFVYALLNISLFASILSPHLMQEYDALNYHMTLPRQHLILNSFAHIPWSSADLFPLPIDFALSPYWFASTIPNKFPQFLFLIGLILVSCSLVKSFSKDAFWSVWCVLFAIMGSHGLGIQMGTAMLDITLCYLFLASLDSYLKKNYALAAAEVTFLFWAKSFFPLQYIALIIGISLLIISLKKPGFKNTYWSFNREHPFKWDQKTRKDIKLMLVIFLILSIFVGGPFVIKSLVISDTPLYPFFPGLIPISGHFLMNNSVNWVSLVDAANTHMTAKDMYGHGRSFLDFFKHFWLLAVPERGVNNSFDYPLGLIYLLLIGPFLVLMGRSLRKKELAILPIFIIMYWLSWWFGSQQSRFLYIPILLLFISVLSSLRFESKVFMGAVVLALAFNTVSLAKAHKSDFFKAPTQSVLREKDRKILNINKLYWANKSRGYVYLDYHDVLYAQFPVMVTKEKLPYVIAYKKVK